MFALSPALSYAQAAVVASIKPLQLIAAALTDGVSIPQLLIPANQSPHNFSLRPSDVRHLAQADIVMWVGPGLETYLTSMFAQESRQERLLEAAALPGIVLLDLTDHAHEHSAGEHYDPHLWLSTANALVLANALHDKLVTIDSAHAAQYGENLNQFAVSLKELDETMQQQFGTLRSAKFAVFHNGTQYFEDQVGLQHQFVLVPDHEIQPGIRHLLGLRVQLADQPVTCLFEDVNSNEATINTVFQDNPVRRVMLDPLGDAVALSKAGYQQLISNMATAMQQCLSPQ
jgi:zinc transport system substrate-binding protein